MRTLLLDTQAWDLLTDAAGNIAVASDPYSVSQDVASAVRTFIGDCYYATNLGVPYFSQVLGQLPPLALFKSLITTQAARVPGCSNPVCFIGAITDRLVTGQIQFTDSNGQTQSVAF